MPIDSPETFRPGTPQTLICGDYLAQQSFRGVYDVTADGQRFLVIKRAGGNTAAAETIVIVENWLDELERLVPSR